MARHQVEPPAFEESTYTRTNHGDGEDHGAGGSGGEAVRFPFCML
jgi:hypothetical protein